MPDKPSTVPPAMAQPEAVDQDYSDVQLEIANLKAQLKQAEAAAMRDRTLLQNLRGIVFYRSEPGGRVTAFGDQRELLAAYTRADGSVDVRAWLDAMHPDERLEYLAFEARRQAQAGEFTMEYRVRDPNDDAYRWVRETGYVVITDEDQVCYDGYLLDITAGKEQERSLRAASDAAMAASRTRGEFLANMSHELRTPLNAIIGFAELIGTEAFGPVGQRRYLDYAEDIRAGADHLLNMVEDILEFTRSESSESELKEAIVDLRDSVSAALRLIRDQANRKKLEIEVDLSAGLPNLRVDERKLRQILLNLVTNAVKFTPEGGRITISAHYDDRTDADMVVEVRDTGIGIAEKDLERVMEPFTQVDASLSRGHGGTGLGLPLSRRLAEMHGGRLDLDSTLAFGTTVRLTLPAARVVPPTVPTRML